MPVGTAVKRASGPHWSPAVTNLIPSTINGSLLDKSYPLKVIKNRRSPVVLIGPEDGSKPVPTAGLQ
jgi:hypothetical protein